MKHSMRFYLFCLLAKLNYSVAQQPCQPQWSPTLADLAYAPNKSSFCPGDNIAVTFLNTSNGAVLNLNWSFTGLPPGQLLNTQSLNYNIAAIAAPGQLTLQGLLKIPQQGNCTFTLQQQVNVTFDLAANAGPDIFVSTGFPSGTIGGFPAATGGAPPYFFSWSPTSNMNFPAIPNPVVNPPNTASYQLTITDVNSCISAPDTVTVYNISSLGNVNQTNYAILQKSPDAGYHNTIFYNNAQTLFFMFEEEYYRPGTGITLNYTILDDANTAIGTVPGLIKTIGDNRFALNVSATSPALINGSFYKLIVRNEKEEIWQTRFKVN